MLYPGLTLIPHPSFSWVCGQSCIVEQRGWLVARRNFWRFCTPVTKGRKDWRWVIKGIFSFQHRSLVCGHLPLLDYSEHSWLITMVAVLPNFKSEWLRGHSLWLRVTERFPFLIVRFFTQYPIVRPHPSSSVGKSIQLLVESSNHLAWLCQPFTHSLRELVD